jgi:prefoldin subunit 5
MGSYKYVTIAGVITALFWMADSLIHVFLTKDGVFEVIPSTFNELLIRTSIAILIIGFGIYVDYSTNKRFMGLDERKAIYKASANEAKKVLREFLHDVKYFESEAENIGGFDSNTIQHLEDALKKTQDRLDSLDEVGDITAENK